MKTYNIVLTVTELDDAKLVGGASKRDYSLVNVSAADVEFLFDAMDKIQTVSGK